MSEIRLHLPILFDIGHWEMNIGINGVLSFPGKGIWFSKEALFAAIPQNYIGASEERAPAGSGSRVLRRQ